MVGLGKPFGGDTGIATAKVTGNRFSMHLPAVPFNTPVDSRTKATDGSPDSVAIRSHPSLFDGPHAPAPHVEIFGPAERDLPKDISFLQRQGIGLPYLLAAIERSRLCGISAAQALIRGGILSEVQYYQCVAAELGLEFVENTPDTATPFFDPPSPDQLDKMATMVAVDGDKRILHIAPDMNQVDALKEVFARHHGFSSRVRVTTQSSNRSALEERSKKSLLRHAVDGLSQVLPTLSARTTISVKQAVCLLLLLQAIGFVLLFADHVALVTLSFKHYPVYSVLVALYREESQIDDLVDSLKKLQWPIEKLEIKLICEADDPRTIAAVRNALKRRNAPHINLVIVPVCKPRTKPKALNFALPLCRGRYLVIYDAEDRPHPLQLKEAYWKFTTSPKNLVCLQAPLRIHNHRESWLSRFFAVEYSTLFDGLLPVLAKHNLPLPLGGTSNHFKRAALERAGGWDPYNVTEDADLGMRLSRMGYSLGTLAKPTYEEAPISVLVWLKQRTRWFKGWLQTWLVHMRDPAKLYRDLGLAGFLSFHIMITGMVVSALVHPLLLYFVGETIWQAISMGWRTVVLSWVFWLDLATILIGYLAFASLALRTLGLLLNGPRVSILWLTPLYWLLLSVAAWRAALHLIYKPHEWEKTPHRIQSKPPKTRHRVLESKLG